MRLNPSVQDGDKTATGNDLRVGDGVRRAPVPSPPQVATSRYVLLRLAETVTGYTVKAMERKIERGDWVEGKVWRRAPDGHILVDLQGYQRWVENQF